MILPSGHAQALRLRPVSRRERRIVAAIAAVAVALLAAVLVAVLSGGHSSAGGCIDYSFPYSVGGQEVYKCGNEARQTCLHPGEAGNGTPQTRAAVIAACRKARLPAG